MKKYRIPQLIFASTAAVYKPNKLFSEEHLLEPNTPYGWSKLYCEQAIFNVAIYLHIYSDCLT